MCGGHSDGGCQHGIGTRRTDRAEIAGDDVPNLTVLVLDDEPTVRELLRRFLELHGYEAIEAGTMSEAVDLIHRTRIGAVILDVRVPGGSGIEVLEHLRTRPDSTKIPAIVLTGGVLTEDEQLTVTRHGAHLFYKPEGFDSLVEFLTQLTGDGRSH